MVFYADEPGVYKTFLYIIFSNKDLEGEYFDVKSSPNRIKAIKSKTDKWFIVKQIFDDRNRIK